MYDWSNFLTAYLKKVPGIKNLMKRVKSVGAIVVMLLKSDMNINLPNDRRRVISARRGRGGIISQETKRKE